MKIMLLYFVSHNQLLERDKEKRNSSQREMHKEILGLV